MGKVCSMRPISKEVLGSTMARIWRINKAAQFIEVSRNVFVIVFENQVDMQKVWNGRPWLFDNQLFVLKEFEGYTPLHCVNFDYECLWVRMHNLPLSCMTKERGRTINVKGESIWIPFSYEKMPRICFSCGCVVHGVKGCSSILGESDGKEDQYGIWMRATQGIRSKTYSSFPKREEETNSWRKMGVSLTQDGGSRKANEVEDARGSKVSEGPKLRGGEGSKGEGSVDEMFINGRGGDNILRENCVEVSGCEGYGNSIERK
ncbi:uncharacterized protein LOC122301670 [Carya illinoinensis]|uniref:uncharacterized protein LOC122301670 n=1 Tax=Carya illinoinensis TaxID=32201 RepID=UPI001C720365|nr:uncharacterized protein LOC122301670 [Carya illinoinensis]